MPKVQKKNTVKTTTECDHSIREGLDKAKEQAKQPIVADFPDTYSLMGQDKVSKTYSFPKSYISYHKPRAVSTEQRTSKADDD